MPSAVSLDTACLSTFIAIDVETANADLASICAIGAASFVNGCVDARWYQLVDPQAPFDPINISIHGIQPEDVAGSPRFADLATHIAEMLIGKVVVTHTRFDRTAIHRAAERSDVTPPNCIWLDSSALARRVWKDCATSGYGLADLCRRIGHEFRHHDALEDAIASGAVLLAAMAHGGLDLDGAILRAGQRIDVAQSKRSGDPNGALYGETVVFTGSLSMPRREAADLAAAAGCEVTRTVSRSVTILVVGDLDSDPGAAGRKSGKHRRAEELAAEGHAIRIIGESDFATLLALT